MYLFAATASFITCVANVVNHPSLHPNAYTQMLVVGDLLLDPAAPAVKPPQRFYL